MLGRDPNVYNLYRYGKLIAVGTKKSLAEFLGIQTESIEYYHNNMKFATEYELEVNEILSTPYYAAYRNQELVAIGSKYQIARAMGVKPTTIQSYSRKSYIENLKTVDSPYVIKVYPK